MKPRTVPLFGVAAAFAPVALLVRYGVLTPLSLAIPPLRRVVMERYSGLIINPMFRRRAPEGEFRRQWAWQEGGARSEEHTSELQSLMRISYAVFCLKKKKNNTLKRTQQSTNN